ncbi:MAG: TatD family hydrolase [Caldilineaceae bacterium]|nr:TatD family hydrolase [Caldilineaceae bacterium]
MLIDSHCHLDLEQFDRDRDEVVARAQAAGVSLIVNPGIDLAHSRAAIALSERYPQLYAAVGIHPNSAADFDAKMIDRLRMLASSAKVVAIGEIGLDYYWDKTPASQQIAAFEAQLALAAELGLPVIIHSREANADVADRLRTWVNGAHFRHSALAGRAFAGVLHAFSGDLALAEEAYEWGFVLSLGGPISFKNAASLHELAPRLRLDRLMLETDAPYLTPHPHRGSRNEPAYVTLVRDKVAELHAVTAQEVAETTSAVALRFYGLENTSIAQFRFDRVVADA